jgi:raffinose/stachyose/melibiose transport system permease protein
MEKQMTQKQLRKAGNITLFVLPGLVIVLTFIVIPLFMSMFNSLFSWNQLLRKDFIGLGNFRKLFSGYPYRDLFLNALHNNVTWFVMTMLIQNTLGLFFGYFLSRNVPGHKVFQRIFFLPVLFSIVAVGYLWGLYLRPNGLVNNILALLGKSDWRQAWLGDTKYATASIILVNIWRWIGFPSLVFMSAVDNVPLECLESAYLDGAGEWKMFWKIVFPLIIPSVTIIVVLTIIGSLNVFEQVYTMAGLDGSPNFATDTIGTLFYRTAFGSVDAGSPEIGIGSAISVIIYGMTFIFSLITVVGSKKKEVRV